MSCDWNIRCIDCNDILRFNDANHQVALMQAIIRHRTAIEALASLLHEEYSIELRTPWGSIDPGFFVKHAGHRLVAHDEYGTDYGNCPHRVQCAHCKSSSKPCVKPVGHEGECSAD